MSNIPHKIAAWLRGRADGYALHDKFPDATSRILQNVLRREADAIERGDWNDQGKLMIKLSEFQKVQLENAVGEWDGWGHFGKFVELDIGTDPNVMMYEWHETCPEGADTNDLGADLYEFMGWTQQECLEWITDGNYDKEYVAQLDCLYSWAMSRRRR